MDDLDDFRECASRTDGPDVTRGDYGRAPVLAIRFGPLGGPCVQLCTPVLCVRRANKKELSPLVSGAVYCVHEHTCSRTRTPSSTHAVYM